MKTKEKNKTTNMKTEVLKEKDYYRELPNSFTIS